jgi:hypothetical protein
MLKNYFTTALRNMLRNKLYSGITIFGLTIGLAVGMLVLLWVQDETSFDGFHRKAASIYRVNSPVGLGKSRQVWATTTAPVAVYAMKEVPGVEDAVRIVGNWDYSLFSSGDKSFNDLGRSMPIRISCGCLILLYYGEIRVAPGLTTGRSLLRQRQRGSFLGRKTRSGR